MPHDPPVSTTYAVTTSLAPAGGSPALDALQAEGVAAILQRSLSQAREAIGPDGSHIAVVDRWVGAHPEGAMLAVVVTASSADLAETAVRALVDHVLAVNPPLAGWRVIETDVRVGGAPVAQLEPHAGDGW